MTILIPLSKLIFGAHLSLISAFLILGYTFIFSSFLYFILPNCGLPRPIILQIFFITCLIFICLPDPILKI